MKKYILLLFLALLVIPGFAQTESTETFEIKGVIGDSAPQGRIYEVSGKIYRFAEDITIQTPSGDALTFADLKGGMQIKIIAEKDSSPDGKEKIKYISIIVMKKQRAGKYEVEWNASDFPSGVYVCSLKSQDFVKNIKMILIR